ncbi:hypothetical protein FUAX_43340 (plasmid) [Fulvitalea axinellae]|uniref:Uncharacterized protein n=1 Tax=Fulvitalea axinellae TaxID=1182444 RepID=A0AAU9D2Q3_9BACT|nr:hypothetical protein FUAX_43340 [Fulvitalea axinellae]
MKNFVLTLALTLWASFGLYAQKRLATQGLTLQFDSKAQITSIKGLSELMPANMKAHLIRIKQGSDTLTATSVRWKGNSCRFDFGQGIKLTVQSAKKKGYLRFDLAKVEGESKIDAVLWGPFPTTVSETVGEYVGVIRDAKQAFGIQSLNAKTTGGKLKNLDGTDPSRGTTATKESFGASLQAFCLNRNKERQMTIWNGVVPRAHVKANPEEKIQGSAIALFATETPKVLDVLERIELAEGLPHTTINGVWSKRSPEANKPYLITSFTEANIDQYLDYCEKLGYNTLYHGHPFKTWGHFELLPNQFPNGWDGMKACVEKAKARGIRIGVHTLTNFITTNDAFITPKPHPGLMMFCVTKLSRDLKADDREIYIENPEDYSRKNSLQALRIGDEIIQFAGVSEEAPYKLLRCKRGVFGTKASAHTKGATVGRLVDHPYKVFFPDFEMQKEMVSNLARFLNHTGVGQIDYDGHEGGWGTGEGESGMDYFSEQLTKEVRHELRNGSSRSNHYYWHSSSYLNWGEPWYGGFTKSQGHYRYKNQALLKRNYTPNMLGWFLLTPNTTLEEFEYMLARSAGYDAGYALYSQHKNFVGNPELDAIAEAVRIWEEARLGGVFSEEQKALLQDVNREFRLKKTGDQSYVLTHFDKTEFELPNLMVQPGQPNDVSATVDSKTKQPLYLTLGAVGKSGSIKKIILDFNGYETLEIEADLPPNGAVIYRGGDEFIIYDGKGRLKKKIKADTKGLVLDSGANTLRLSAEFESGADLTLKGYVRTPGKTETLKSKRPQ